MVAFKGLYRSLSQLAKSTSKRHLRRHEGWIISAYMNEKKSQAVSDGELNMSARGSSGSYSSLPGTEDVTAGQANSILSWAVSFEKLLEDPIGVRYFTAFLRSEVSAENILFWQACEKFKKIPASHLKELKEEALAIYQTYLSENAPYSVNIDDTAKTEEKDLEQPTPNMFTKAQAQIFKLMKMDSYRRFVRSPLYQSCSLASVEGRNLPCLPSEPACMGSWEDMVSRSPSLSDGKKNKKPTTDSDARETHRQKRGSWGAVEMSLPAMTVSRQDSQISVKSNSSVELGSLFRQIENGRSSPRPPEQGSGGASGRVMVEGGYCCVYLPDGSASLAPTRPGMLLRDMLAGLCEKRGFPLKDVVIYLQGKDKQPLSLEQDCSVVRDQQVSLELRVTFALEVVFSSKTVGIVVKSSKTLQDALSTVLQKHQLRVQDAVVTVSGSDEPLSWGTSVFKLANRTLRLDKIKAKDQSSSLRPGGQSSGTQVRSTGPSGAESRPSPRQPKPSKNHDMEGLIDMVSRAQCSRVDDQRGLLTKEHLELPLFLQLPSSQDHGGEPGQDLASSTTGSMDTKAAACGTTTPNSAAEVKSTTPRQGSDPKETSL